MQRCAHMLYFRQNGEQVQHIACAYGVTTLVLLSPLAQRAWGCISVRRATMNVPAERRAAYRATLVAIEAPQKFIVERLLLHGPLHCRLHDLLVAMIRLLLAMRRVLIRIPLRKNKFVFNYLLILILNSIHCHKIAAADSSNFRCTIFSDAAINQLLCTN